MRHSSLSSCMKRDRYAFCPERETNWRRCPPCFVERLAVQAATAGLAVSRPLGTPALVRLAAGVSVRPGYASSRPNPGDRVGRTHRKTCRHVWHSSIATRSALLSLVLRRATGCASRDGRSPGAPAARHACCDSASGGRISEARVRFVTSEPLRTSRPDSPRDPPTRLELPIEARSAPLSLVLRRSTVPPAASAAVPRASAIDCLCQPRRQVSRRGRPWARPLRDEAGGC